VNRRSGSTGGVAAGTCRGFQYQHQAVVAVPVASVSAGPAGGGAVALFLAFVSSGLVLLGASLWVSPLINGAALILAVAFSTWASRMQARQFRAQQLKQLDAEDATDSDAFREAL
jgi:ribose/xylose/arabinose/galactoside ABC-type transport system permease subunit